MTDNGLTDTGGRAFPRAAFESQNIIDDGAAGMSLRDWVMGQCIAAAFGAVNELHVADGETPDQARTRYWKDVSRAAAVAADAMIAVRDKK
jgi:hypothetical protein